MESYIPLVKAIIISTMFSWGTSSVLITDQYVLKEINYSEEASGYEVKEYQIYDLKKNFIHIIDQNLQKIDSSRVDKLVKFEVLGIGGQNQIKITSVAKIDFGGFKCKEEIVEAEAQAFYQPWKPDEFTVISYSVISYFAKIPWLDSVLDTKDKRDFAGFDRQEYAPYHYLINKFVKYPNMEPQNNVLRIIEKTEVDTTLIHTLLSLPVKKN